MDLLKKLFPFSFGTSDVATLVIKIIVYLVASLVLEGIILGLLGWLLPFLGFVWGILGSLIGIYILGGIAVAVLDFCKVLK